MAEFETIVARIREILPAAVDSVRLLPDAEQYVVAEVNHDWIFRFIRDPEDPSLENEKQFLPEFLPLTPLPIPDLVFTGVDFVGYRKIEGQVLGRKVLQALTEDARRRVATQLANFLSALHRFPLDKARSIGLTEGWGGFRSHAAHIFRAHVATLLPEGARAKCLEFLDHYFTLAWEPVVVHGDVASDNLLFDRGSQVLCGVIDFGHITIDDAATDFAFIAREFGHTFLNYVITNYTGHHDHTLGVRIEMREKGIMVFDAAYSFETGQEDRLMRRVGEIAETFAGNYGKNKGIDEDRPTSLAGNP